MAWNEVVRFLTIYVPRQNLRLPDFGWDQKDDVSFVLSSFVLCQERVRVLLLWV